MKRLLQLPLSHDRTVPDLMEKVSMSASFNSPPLLGSVVIDISFIVIIANREAAQDKERWRS
jgi:hypothetical protein